MTSLPLVPSIERAVNFQSPTGTDDGVIRYAGYGNTPEATRLHRALARLEGAESALVTASGMGAIACVLRALVQAGDHVLAAQQCYGGTRALLQDLTELGITVTFADPFDRDIWPAAIRPTTRVVLVESPVNPNGRFLDLPSIKMLAGADRPVVVDATLATPINYHPLTHGADLVVHSATKYLGGHNDLLAGVVAGSAALVECARQKMSIWGQASDGTARWLLERGLRTLAVRVAHQNTSAMTIAAWLERQPTVRRVHYLGLPSHPDHSRASQWMRGFGGVLGFEVADGPQASALIARLNRFVCTSSFGGVDALVSEPRFNSHAELSREEREAIGIPDGFIRLSVGLEDPEDLIADLAQAFEER
jgi:cystathionine beta-lyase/cystathionine gamma-synthase